MPSFRSAALDAETRLLDHFQGAGLRWNVHVVAVFLTVDDHVELKAHNGSELRVEMEIAVVELHTLRVQGNPGFIQCFSGHGAFQCGQNGLLGLRSLGLGLSVRGDSAKSNRDEGDAQGLDSNIHTHKIRMFGIGEKRKEGTSAVHPL